MAFPHGSLIDLPGMSTSDSGNRLGPMTRWIRDHSELITGKSVLDLGSNAGHFPILYAELGAIEVVAVEGRKDFEECFENDLRPQLRRKEVVRWITRDVREFHAMQRFDVLSCLGLIYHVEDGWSHLRRLIDESGASIMLLDSQLWHKDGDVAESNNQNTNCLRDVEAVPHPTKATVERWLKNNRWTYELVLHNWQTVSDMRGMWLVNLK